jgi:hypothetical protein
MAVRKSALGFAAYRVELWGKCADTAVQKERRTRRINRIALSLGALIPRERPDEGWIGPRMPCRRQRRRRGRSLVRAA